MPRQHITQSGQPAQPVAATPGQVYGAGEDQMAMQRAMPVPQVGTVPAGGAVAAGAPTTPAASADLATLLRQAQGLRDQTGLLTQPTMRPDEPVTAGLVGGPGPGPEALVAQQGSPAGNMLRRLTQLTGDPAFAELARRARQ